LEFEVVAAGGAAGLLYDGAGAAATGLLYELLGAEIIGLLYVDDGELNDGLAELDDMLAEFAATAIKVEHAKTANSKLRNIFFI